MGRGSSGAGKGGGGSLGALMTKAANETNPNRVLNQVDDSEMGVTFQKLNPLEKSTIKGVLSLRKGDVNFLANGTKNNATIDQGIRVNGKLYRVIIGVSNGNVVYSLNQGRKKIVKEGTYANVANQLAILL